MPGLSSLENSKYRRALEIIKSKPLILYMETLNPVSYFPKIMIKAKINMGFTVCLELL